MSILNSAAKSGHNIEAPLAQEIAGRLTSDYAALIESAQEAIRQADELPVTVESSEHVGVVSAAVIKLRDIANRTEAHRKAEGEPYLRSKEAVDAFFFRLKEQIDKVRQELAARVDAFKQRQLAEERARRAAEAAEARRKLEEARLAQWEAEAAKRRARSVEATAARETEVARARVDARMADEDSERATLATMASSSALVGERFEGRERSGQVGMRKSTVVLINDISKLDLELLRPFMKEEHLLMALRRWAASTGYQQEMPGATVTLRDSTVIR